MLVTVTFWFLGKFVTVTCWLFGKLVTKTCSKAGVAKVPPMNVRSRITPTVIISFLFSISPPVDSRRAQLAFQRKRVVTLRWTDAKVADAPDEGMLLGA